MLHKKLNLILADDDKDDRFFFERALGTLPLDANLQTVSDGEQLMKYLKENTAKLPDGLFLDLNMPRKNGAECLDEIKADPQLKNIPVILYSTSLNESVADVLFKKGAHFYVRKCDFPELKKLLYFVLTTLTEEIVCRPSRDEFVLHGVEA